MIRNRPEKKRDHTKSQHQIELLWLLRPRNHCPARTLIVFMSLCYTHTHCIQVWLESISRSTSPRSSKMGDEFEVRKLVVVWLCKTQNSTSGCGCDFAFWFLHERPSCALNKHISSWYCSWPSCSIYIYASSPYFLFPSCSHLHSSTQISIISLHSSQFNLFWRRKRNSWSYGGIWLFDTIHNTN